MNTLFEDIQYSIKSKNEFEKTSNDGTVEKSFSVKNNDKEYKLKLDKDNDTYALTLLKYSPEDKAWIVIKKIVYGDKEIAEKKFDKYKEVFGKKVVQSTTQNKVMVQENKNKKEKTMNKKFIQLQESIGDIVQDQLENITTAIKNGIHFLTGAYEEQLSDITRKIQHKNNELKTATSPEIKNRISTEINDLTSDSKILSSQSFDGRTVVLASIITGVAVTAAIMLAVKLYRKKGKSKEEAKKLVIQDIEAAKSKINVYKNPKKKQQILNRIQKVKQVIS